MDLETENRLFMEEEMWRLRLQENKEGVLAYSSPKPGVRQHPNTRFIAAAVVGVEQANQITEVDEMRHAREKELEMDMKMKCRVNDHAGLRCKRHISQPFVTKTEKDDRLYANYSSVRYSRNNSHSDTKDELQDDELEVYDEMWRAREKKLEMIFKINCRINDHVGLRRKRNNIMSPASKIEVDSRPWATSYLVKHSRSISYSDSKDGLEDDDLEEYDEMWRAREKKVEMDFKTNCRTNDHTGLRYKKHNIISPVLKIEQDSRPWGTSSSVRYSHNVSNSDGEDGLSGDEVEEFLRPRSAIIHILTNHLDGVIC